MSNEKKKKEVAISFPIPAEEHKKILDIIVEINKDVRYNISRRDFLKCSYSTLMKNFKKVYGLKGGEK